MSTPPRPLSGTDARLTERYDVALLDLDGVVYLGPAAVEHAPQALDDARAAGMQLAFVTNNAARTPAAVAAHLTELGVAASPDEVVTSAQAAAHVVADRFPAGTKVLVLGDEGLREALTERGLTPVDSADDDPAAVAQGYSPRLGWAALAEGAVAINRGALWVATNLDRTVPSARGPLPGNGSLVAALRHATGHDPDVATGKPDPTMHLESVERTGARNPLIVGDRLDTDIEGAVRAGCASLLVLTGVTGPGELLTAPAGSRPTFLGRDLRALLIAHPDVTLDGDRARCGRWVAERDADGPAGGPQQVTLTLATTGAHGTGPESVPGSGPSSTSTSGASATSDPNSSSGAASEPDSDADDELDALRALAAAAWTLADQVANAHDRARGDDERRSAAGDEDGATPEVRVRATGADARQVAGAWGW